MYSHCVSHPPVPITASPCLLDLVPTRICAGFPSPAEDLGAERIDLSKVLITHPQATFLQRVSGHSMRDAGIFDNDILVIDRAIKPRHKMIVVAVVDGEFTVKQLYQFNCSDLVAITTSFVESVRRLRVEWTTSACARGDERNAFGFPKGDVHP